MGEGERRNDLYALDISLMSCFMFARMNCCKLEWGFCSDKAYFVDLFVRASNAPAIKMYEKVMVLFLIIHQRPFYYMNTILQSVKRMHKFLGVFLVLNCIIHPFKIF